LYKDATEESAVTEMPKKRGRESIALWEAKQKRIPLSERTP